MIDKIFLKDDNYMITNVEETDDKIHINVKSKLTKCKCPNCKIESEIYHSTYIRNIQDIPIHNCETWLKVSSYEFKCLNPTCETKTFTEELSFAKKYKVKTNALWS